MKTKTFYHLPLAIAAIGLLFSLAIPYKQGESSTTAGPFIIAGINVHWVMGQNWPLGTVVTMTIDDPTNGVGVDYTDSALSITNGQDTTSWFDLTNRITLKAKFIISLTGGGITRTMTVMNLWITTIDTKLNLLAGTGDPNGTIMICPDPGFAGDCRYALVDSDGNWSAPAYKPNTFVLKTGFIGWAHQGAGDGNWTHFPFTVPYLKTYLPLITTHN